MVLPQDTETDNECAQEPGDYHYFSGVMMPPGVQWSRHQHGSANNQSCGNYTSGESFEVAADSPAKGLHRRSLQAAQIAFGETPEDAARVAGRITYKAFQFAAQLSGFFFYSLD